MNVERSILKVHTYTLVYRLVMSALVDIATTLVQERRTIVEPVASSLIALVLEIQDRKDAEGAMLMMYIQFANSDILVQHVPSNATVPMDPVALWRQETVALRVVLQDGQALLVT